MSANGAGRPASPSDERTPLLRPTSAAQNDEQDKPLPRDQLFLLCLARLVEPVAFFSIFPFLNEMIQEVGLCLTGFVNSLFTLLKICLFGCSVGIARRAY